jgi:hypothetical protein
VDGVARQVAHRAAAEKAGLIEIEANSAFDVSAWLTRGGAIVGEVPAFGEIETYQAGVDVQLGDLPRPRAMASLLVGAANVSEQTASCQATLFDRAGRQLAEIPFEVAAKSVTRESAAKWMGRIDSVRVTCDQSFYPFGFATEQGGLTPVFAKGIGPNGPCQYFLMLTKVPGGIGSYAASQEGLFHDATKAKPKGIICIKAPSQLKVAKAVFEWEVTAGPWSTRNKAGMHNLAYVFLDRYRSGVVGNVNSAGPNKSFLKVMQNVGMPKGSNTNAKAGYELQKDVTYSFRYTFDAHNKLFTLQAFMNGVEIQKFSKEVKPGNNQTLVVTPYGKGDSQTGLAMVAEFGNYVGQHAPEEATIGWKYRNFRLHMTLK